MFMNRWLFRHEIIELNELSPEEEAMVFSMLQPLHGDGEKARFLESQADSVIDQARRPQDSTPLSSGAEEDRNVIERVTGVAPRQQTGRQGSGGPLLRTKQAAQYLAIGERQLQYEVEKENITCVRLGKRCIRFTKEDLDEYVSRHRNADMWTRGGGRTWQG